MAHVFMTMQIYVFPKRIDFCPVYESGFCRCKSMQLLSRSSIADQVPKPCRGAETANRSSVIIAVKSPLVCNHELHDRH